MTPRLVLLTGPAAGEVAQVLRDETTPTGVMPVHDGHWVTCWDQVREYWAAPLAIRDAFMDHSQTVCRDEEAGDIEAAIRSLPGGEAWLVGLVLPEMSEAHSRWGFRKRLPGCIGPLEHPVAEPGPARLAILAPEPPPLLVERVRAWGGEVWECGISAAPATAGKCLVTFGTKCFYADTWPEVVRAALGEVAP